MPIASLENRKDRPTPQVDVKKPSALKRLAFLSAENIERRKGREIVVGSTISPQSPIREIDMIPFMEAHEEVAEAAVDHLNSSLEFLEKGFSGVKLYRLTEEEVQVSVHNVYKCAFEVKATESLVNVMMQNLDVHKVLADKLVRVRIATETNDLQTLVDELLEFAKFFDDKLWSSLNIISEKIWHKTGFAIGKPVRDNEISGGGLKQKVKNAFRGFHFEGFSRDFHLQWMRLLKDPFIHSVLGAVAEAAKSLAGYKETNDEFIRKRKEIEQAIGTNPVLAALKKRLTNLYTEQEKALRLCQEITEVLTKNRDCPKESITITEAQVQAAREKANDLDYRIEQAITQYSTAISVTLAADENAETARLAGHAIQLHVRTIANLFLSCASFITKTAAFFTAKQLLVLTGQMQQLSNRGSKISDMHQVKDDMRKLSQAHSGKPDTEVTKAHGVSGEISRLSKITKGSPDANAKVVQSVDKAITAKKEAQTALSRMQAPVRITDSNEEDSCELIWYCFQTLTEPKFCKLCEREINSGEMVARPHYCEHRTGGVPETIKQDGKPVVANWYVCNECFTELTEIKNRRLAQGEKLVIHDANCGKH